MNVFFFIVTGVAIFIAIVKGFLFVVLVFVPLFLLLFFPRVLFLYLITLTTKTAANGQWIRWRVWGRFEVCPWARTPLVPL